ncbi:MAG: TetR family transcriptional regulator [Hyphomicrobiales bacterium]|jgi:AcrR family transcriptional regulator
MTAETGLGRKASKEVRKQQLIEATIQVLAQKGYAALTVADVARAAGLSTGIIIFHFVSKDELLASVLRSLAEEYYANWKQAVAAAEDNPAARLAALVLADFNPEVYSPYKLAAWIAFWGESQGRPVYEQICAGYDAERLKAGWDYCRDLVKAGGYSLDPELTMKALDAMGDGLWLGVAQSGSGLTGRLTPQECIRIMQTSLAAFFPRHFTPPAG